MTIEHVMPGQLLLVATHNSGKQREIAALLAPFGIKTSTPSAFDVDEPEETGSSFCENATLKARYCAARTGLVALADDSGLSVEALDGAPGIFSARWAGPDRDFASAMLRIWEELNQRNIAEQDRRAKFVCAMSLAWPSGELVEVEGEIHGKLVWPGRGEHGFGYDPIFVPNGHNLTFGQMAPHDKDAISHRARAFAIIAERCFCRLPSGQKSD